MKVLTTDNYIMKLDSSEENRIETAPTELIELSGRNGVLPQHRQGCIGVLDLEGAGPGRIIDTGAGLYAGAREI